jgi:TPR repeat protein
MRALLFLTLAAIGFAQPPAGRPPLRERAAAGDAEAQFTLGKNYEGGRSGLKKDYAEAANWYRKSADQGNVYAQASLGIFYHAGKGVPLDNVQAEMWLSISADRAPANDRDTIVEMRDSVARHLTAEQLEQARKLAREWTPRRQP